MGIASNDRSALSSFQKEFFTPLRNASKATVGRTLFGSNDGFLVVGVVERFVGTKLSLIFGFATRAIANRRRKLS